MSSAENSVLGSYLDLGMRAMSDVTCRAKGLFNSLMANDLKDYDVVVPLAVGNDPKDDHHLFVGKGGQGKIITMSPDDVKAQIADGGVKLKDVSDLSKGVEAANLKSVTVAAANLYVEHIGNMGEVGRFPFNPEKPETANPSKLDEIKAGLWNARANLINGATDINYDADGNFEGVTQTNDPSTQIKQLDKMITQIDNVQNTADYRDDLKEGLKCSTIPADIQKGIEFNLNSETVIGGPAANNLKI